MSENEEKNSNPKILMFRKDVEIIFVLKNISLYQKKKKRKKENKTKELFYYLDDKDKTGDKRDE